MTANEDSGATGDEATVRIEAPPDRIWEIVTDIAGMGRLSPECTGGRWLDGATGAKVGARFKGTNKRGLARWSTTNTVVTSDADREFAFETKQSGARWRYRLEADGTGTRVTESRELFRERPWVAVIFTKLMLGGDDAHTAELRKGMQESLRRLKDLAEAAT